MDTGQQRRREGTGASARSLLLTLLGEFVLPRGGTVWTSALVAGLAAVEVEEKAARQALARTAGEGLLLSERDGRRTRWRLSLQGQRLLTEGRDRIYSFGRAPRSWDGRWLVLAVSVPETQRRLRHQLRTRLTWNGLGSPVPGLWVCPDVGKQGQVAAVVAELGVDALSFTGPFGAVGDEASVVRRAWQLDAVEGQYRAFLDEAAGWAVTDDAGVFAAQVRLVQAWRRFPFLDPALPDELLPGNWPGAAAGALFHERHAAWHEGAQRHWDALCDLASTRL